MRGDWFAKARFGMFVHWGPYSVLGRCVWARYWERIPAAEYAKLAWRFNPKKYQPQEWVALAQEAGMRYMVLCTRQHPGYCLFDSAVSEFTAPKMAPGRDLVAEYVEACRSRGMRIGFYYSLLDWRFPSYFEGPERDPKGWARLVHYVHAQVRELCSNYGKIDILWYDGRWPWSAEDWKAGELNAMVRKLQPGILINNRSGLPEDFGTPEQHVPVRHSPTTMWESCMTINDHWGYAPRDRNWKPARQLIRNLVRCVSGGGNYLLNVGPKPDGTMPAPSVKRLRKIGEWMRANEESVRGAGACPVSMGTFNGASTARGSTVYFHMFLWPGKEAAVGNLKSRILSAQLLATGEQVEFVQEKDRLVFKNLPARAPDPSDTVIKVELEGELETHPDFRYIP